MMSDQNSQPLACQAVNARFVDEIRQILDHLYDFPYLQHHALAQRLPPALRTPGDTAGQALRRQVIKAIESLGPEPGAGFRSAQSRVYNMLQLRYVEGMTALEAAHRLSISPRQAHRDLRRGEENVAELLWAMLLPDNDLSSPESDLPLPPDELEEMRVDLRIVNATELIERARNTIDKLAAALQVSLAFQPPVEPVWVSADVMVAQQVLVGTLSHIVKRAAQGRVDMTLLTADDLNAELVIAYPLRTPQDEMSSLNPLIDQLAQRISWSVRQGERRANNASRDGALDRIHLTMPRRSKVALLIDDNEGLVSLLDRYLINQPCRPVRAAGSLDGLRLAQELQPDVIVLDIMLPTLDGWEVLQLLRNDPRTSHIPIIICSVFHDPELALSLGASLVLRKPVERREFLEAIRLVGAL